MVENRIILHVRFKYNSSYLIWYGYWMHDPNRMLVLVVVCKERPRLVHLEYY